MPVVHKKCIVGIENTTHILKHHILVWFGGFKRCFYLLSLPLGKMIHFGCTRYTTLGDAENQSPEDHTFPHGLWIGMAPALPSGTWEHVGWRDR